MINWDKINEKVSIKKTIIPLYIAISILLIINYVLIVQLHIDKNIFASEMERISEKNSTPMFSIDKIYLCSSANAVDSSQGQNLGELDLYQYTDIAVYINNYKDEGLTKKNTVKDLYIDNIELELDNNSGIPSLLYTNLLKIGSKDVLKNMVNLSLLPESNDKIDFNIVSTNKENQEADYDNPTFYADCSNPITLKYVNKLNKQYTIGNNSSAKFDGSILQKAGVPLEDLNCRVKFKINIINNEGDYNSAWINFKIPLNDIYNGTSIKSKKTVGKEFYFFAF